MRGVFITHVSPDSPAAQTLQTGDRILEVGVGVCGGGCVCVGASCNDFKPVKLTCLTVIKVN